MRRARRASRSSLLNTIRMRPAYIHRRRLLPALWLMSTFLVAGCGMGSHAIKKNRLDYNEVMVHTDRQELLLNIVRLRYRDTPEWLVPNSVNPFVWFLPPKGYGRGNGKSACGS